MSYLKSMTFFITLCIIIELLLEIGGASPAAFAKPSEILFELHLFVDPSEHFIDAVYTTLRSLFAFFISLPLGLLIGALVQKSLFCKGELKGLVDFFRSVPGTTLVPLFFVIFGIGEASKVASAIYGGALAVAISVIIGLQQISDERKYSVTAMYSNEFVGFWRFEFLEILPTALVGFRTALSLSLVLVTVAEMFMGSSSGLGSLIIDSRYAGNVPLLYSSIFVTGVIGFLMNNVASKIEARVLYFYRK
ncbi:ABC transporter permease subunit [Pseudoalteromonas piscicida]|uniref:ABC transporter permease n=1 Tax=Pseudoalteromonas piscicida TaxID=43662 RepID=UPI0030C9AF90